jgi:hypothetical protein
MCIRCERHEAPAPLGLCHACSVQVRVEIAEGQRRLDAYLGAWAAFDAWLREHQPEPIAA